MATLGGMNPRAFSFALRAAAKVAFATGVAACSSVVVVEPEAETDETNDDPIDDGATTSGATSSATAGSSSSSSGVVDPPVRPVCEEPPSGFDVYEEATFACCVEATSVHLLSGALPEGPDADPQIYGCCRQIIFENYSAIWGGEPLVHDAPVGVIEGCCVLMHGNTSCSPWGPPTPPAYDEDDEREPASGPRSRQSRDGVFDLRVAARALAPDVPCPANDTERLNAIETWRARMVNEATSAVVFEALARQLEDAGVDAEWRVACAGFAGEERRHGLLCGAVVEALGGEAIAPHKPEEAFPRHRDVSALEGALRNVLSVGCLSETVAVSLIGAERYEMREGALRDLLTGIWSDEIGHARFGWRFVEAHLGSLDAAARARLTRYLRVAFRELERHELAHLPVSARAGVSGADLGLCDGRAARNLFYATVTDVIVPRLDALGLDATLAWRTRGDLRAPAHLHACA